MGERKKKILILVTHSLSEIDVILPLFAGAKAKYEIDVELVFAVKNIYRQFMSNKFYKFCVKELGIKVASIQLPNKFDYRDSKLFNYRVGWLLVKFYLRILFILNCPLMVRKLLNSDVYMHEFTNQRGSTFLLHKVAGILGRTIFTYQHAVSFEKPRSENKKISQSEESIFLLFHEINKEFANSIGYTNQYVIGFPKFFKEWTDLIQKYDVSEYHGREIVVIYSRPAGHKVYMDLDKYVTLLIESYRVIRQKMGNILIVVKPHPREDIHLIQEIITKNDLINLVVSHEHASVLARDAIFTISFFTSCVLDSLSLGVPTVEFYKEAKNFRLSIPLGSPYKNLGIDSVDCEEGLEKFVQTVIMGEYLSSTVIREISSIKDVDFLRTC